MLLKIIRIILLLFSLYGYSQYLYSRLKLKAELIMPMLLSFFGSAIFLGGLLNITKETAAVIFLLGVILCAVSVKRRYSPSGLITGGTVICAAALAVLLAFTYGTKLMGYDNFSQWGTVVRLIVTENRFPNFEDTVICFQSYPVGSASLIYYFAKITGIRSEWFFIWIQQVATVCSACSIFAFCRKKRPIEYLSASAAVFCILFCVLNITAGLQVDALLSCLGIAGISVCFYYRESPETALYATIPINIFLLAVKNSGVFFAVIISLFCLLRIIKCRGFKVAVSPKKIFPLLSPFVALLLWDKHVAFSFSGGMTAKHSMSAENYSQVFSEKTPELISQITRDFLKKVFSLDNAFFIILIALLASLLIVKIFRLTVPLCEAEDIYWNAETCGAVMPGAAEMLEAVTALGIRYGVVSNLTMSGEALARRIKRLIPHAAPELVVTSSDIGVRKPNPMIFRYALSRCGATAEQAWFCGDNPQADVEGSFAVGIYPVWYDSSIECPYRDKERETVPSCDMLRIREWSEMTGLLELL